MERKNHKKELTGGDEFVKIQKNNTLIEWVFDYIGMDNAFTGQINIEINLTDGEVKDFFISQRKREVV